MANSSMAGLSRSGVGGGAGEIELRKRLTGRGTDSAEIIEHRMHNSLEEMQQWNKYTYCLISADKETDYGKFKALLEAEALQVSRILTQ